MFTRDEAIPSVCRICYCSSEEEELITPCKCLGSVQYIHRSCLMKWLRTGMDQCEICKSTYKFQRHIKPYRKRVTPNITSWHFAWIVKELVVLDWFHFLETVFICISLTVINRLSSFDLVYQFALIGVVELVYYTLNIFSCFYLLYYERWARLNIEVLILNYNDDVVENGKIGILLACFNRYAALLRRNKRLEQVVEQIDEADGEAW